MDRTTGMSAQHTRPTSHRLSGSAGTIHAVTQGDPANPAMVLIHGYPDNLDVWNAVADTLALAFFVIRYDCRGAGRSDRPKRVKDYRLSCLMNDLATVVYTLIPDHTFHLVGHDWGSIQGWEAVTLSELKPRIRSFTSISGPCLDYVGVWFRDCLRERGTHTRKQALQQLSRSWYILLFQIPALPPAIWRLGLGKAWPDLLAWQEGIHGVPPNPFQTEDGCDGIMLYRANVLPKLINPEPKPTGCPVQVIIPREDRFVAVELLEDLPRWTQELTCHALDAPHWAPLSSPDLLAARISAWAHQWPTG